MNDSKKPVFIAASDLPVRALSQCLAKIAEQQMWLRRIQSLMPPHIAEHATHCVINGTRLIIYTHSAVWASQIRFFHEVILNNIRASGQGKIVKVQIKILPPDIKRTVRGKSARLPSADTVKSMLGQVDDRSTDVVQIALASLAKTLHRRREEVD